MKDDILTIEAHIFKDFERIHLITEEQHTTDFFFNPRYIYYFKIFGLSPIDTKKMIRLFNTNNCNLINIRYKNKLLIAFIEKYKKRLRADEGVANVSFQAHVVAVKTY